MGCANTRAQLVPAPTLTVTVETSFHRFCIIPCFVPLFHDLGIDVGITRRVVDDRVKPRFIFSRLLNGRVEAKVWIECITVAKVFSRDMLILSRESIATTHKLIKHKFRDQGSQRRVEVVDAGNVLDSVEV